MGEGRGEGQRIPGRGLCKRACAENAVSVGAEGWILEAPGRRCDGNCRAGLCGVNGPYV